jgi:hypothetical protein
MDFQEVGWGAWTEFRDYPMAAEVNEIYSSK